MKRWLRGCGLAVGMFVVAVASGLVGIAVMLLVRCPGCGHSLGLWAFRTGSLTTWHERLMKVAACSACGHIGSAKG